MHHTVSFTRLSVAAGLALLASAGFAQSAPAKAPAAAAPYKIVNTAQFPGTGGLDYVFADNAARRLYVARGAQVHVFDLDALNKEVGTVTAQGHGAIVDPVSHHGFVSSKPITMFDTQTLATIKTIDVQGSPDGMLFEPFTQRIYVLSHTAPNVTVIDAKDGAVVDTIDLGGAPEQGQSDGMGHVYIDVQNQANVAVVDAKTLKVTAHYNLSSGVSGPAGLALDIKNHILFAMCRTPATCVILDAADGKILASLPLAGGSDGGVFNPATMEAFSSSGGGSGTLSVIKENSPTSFEIAQTVQTKSGAKTLTLDTKTNQIVLITTEPMPAAAAPAATPATPAATPAAPAPAVAAATPPAAPPAGAPAQGGQGQRGGQRGGGGRGGPAFLDLIVVGR